MGVGMSVGVVCVSFWLVGGDVVGVGLSGGLGGGWLVVVSGGSGSRYGSWYGFGYWCWSGGGGGFGNGSDSGSGCRFGSEIESIPGSRVSGAWW